MPATFGDGFCAPRELRSSATLLRLTERLIATPGFYHAGSRSQVALLCSAGAGAHAQPSPACPYQAARRAKGSALLGLALIDRCPRATRGVWGHARREEEANHDRQEGSQAARARSPGPHG